MERKQNPVQIPLTERPTISLTKAAQLFGIGKRELDRVAARKDCQFVICVGIGKRLVKTQRFADYLNSTGTHLSIPNLF